MGVVWAEPSEQVNAVVRPRDPQVVAVLEAVCLNPGKWAIVKWNVPKNQVGSAMRRWRSWYPQIEFTSRQETERANDSEQVGKTYTIYARTV